MFISSLKVTSALVVSNTEVAPFAGVTEVTIGFAVSASFTVAVKIGGTFPTAPLAIGVAVVVKSGLTPVSNQAPSLNFM